jgi:periplasmic protein TonB
MRCSECDGKPQREERHCECCGHLLTPDATSAHEAPRVADPNQQELRFEAPSPRCGSCGGPAPDGELCDSCRQAFSSVLGKAKPAPVAAMPALIATLAPTPADVEPVPVSSAATDDPVDVEPSPDLVAGPSASERQPDLMSEAEPVIMPMAAPEDPAPPMASAPRRHRSELAAVAAVAIIAVIGLPLGALWLRKQAPTQDVMAGATVPTASVAANAPVTAANAPAPTAAADAKSTPAEPDKAPAPPAPEVVPQPVKPAPRAPRAPAKPAKIEPAVNADRAVAPAPTVSAPVAPEPPPAAVPPPAPAPEAPRPVLAQAPVGHLYNAAEVDEAPKATAKVSPQLASGVADRAGKDVVVVRALISQTGHPFRVDLLRRSRFGSAVDEAVVAAVKQWMFSPARKRGEAVSCWYNFAVPLAD